MIPDPCLTVPFDWNTVTPEALAAIVEGIAECIDWDNPMVTNESGMELLRFLHGRGFALTPLALVDADDALTMWTALGFPKDVQPLLDVVAAARAYIRAAHPLKGPAGKLLFRAVAALG